jgi:dienelactone hydrolase
MANLKAAGRAGDTHLLVYPGAGHMVGTYPYIPKGTIFETPGRRENLGGTRDRDEAAQVDGWPRFLAFLRSVPRVSQR